MPNRNEPTEIRVLPGGNLDEALSALAPGGGIIHLSPGNYDVKTTMQVELSEQQHIYLRGAGRASVVRFWATDGGPLLRLRGVPDSWWPDLKITIRDITFVGTQQSGDALHLLWPNDALVDACFFQGFGGTAVYVGPNATNVTIRDCWMRDCKRSLHADNLHHLTFHGNQTRSLKDGQEQAEQVYIGRHCREVRVVNNHLAYGHAEGIILDGTAQHVVANNTIEGFPIGIRAVDCRDITVNANYIHCPTGIRMEGDNRGIAVTANIFTDNHMAAVDIAEPGLSGGHVFNANIVRQSVYNDGQRGFALGDAHDCVITGNLFEDLSSEDSVTAVDLGRHVVQGNRTADTARRAREQFGERTATRPGPELESPFGMLTSHLRDLPETCDRITLTFGQINAILGSPMPGEARSNSGWWANSTDTPQGRSWIGAGWLAAIVKRIEGRIVFVRLPGPEESKGGAL